MADDDCSSDDNFWRSLSNLTLNVDLPSSPDYAPPSVDPFGTGCDNTAEMWSVSQATPIRRAIINGSVVFQDYCANNNFASGGFIADSKVSGNLNFFGNQQYLTRNAAIGGTNGALWNMVYSGVVGAPAPVFNEMPYDPPSQSAWMATPTQDGYPAFLVSPNVTTFQGYGLGSYSFFNQGVAIFATEAFQVPDRPDGQFHDVLTQFLNGSGGINSVINGTGAAVDSANHGPSDVVTYP